MELKSNKLSFFDHEKEAKELIQVLEEGKETVGLSMTKENELMQLIKHNRGNNAALKVSKENITIKNKLKKEQILEQDRVGNALIQRKIDRREGIKEKR